VCGFCGGTGTNCEVCELSRFGVALVSCEHSRFCADTVAQIANGCAICRSVIDSILCACCRDREIDNINDLLGSCFVLTFTAVAVYFEVPNGV